VYLYQIGPWRGTLVTSDYQIMSFTHDITYRVTETALTHMSGSLSHASPVNPLLATGSGNYTGTLICGLSGCGDVATYTGRIMSLGGRPYVPIIAYENLTGCGSAECDGSCGKCQGRLNRGRFMLTYGTVTAIKRSTSVDMDRYPQEDYAAFDVSFTYYPLWEPVDRIRYKWWGSAMGPWDTNETLDLTTITQQPRGPRIEMQELTYPKNSKRGFQRLRFSSDLGGNPFVDPMYVRWGYGPKPDTDSIESTELVLAYVPPYNTTRADYWNDVADLAYTMVSPATGFWPAPPRNLYYFQNLPTAGSLGIAVNGITPDGVSYSRTATLDLSLLNTAVATAGYTAINATTDRLLVGATSRGGGYYYRLVGGVYTALPVYIPWAYNGAFPGESATGYFNTAITGPTGVLAAQAHIYRGM